MSGSGSDLRASNIGDMWFRLPLVAPLLLLQLLVALPPVRLAAPQGDDVAACEARAATAAVAAFHIFSTSARCREQHDCAFSTFFIFKNAALLLLLLLLLLYLLLVGAVGLPQTKKLLQLLPPMLLPLMLMLQLPLRLPLLSLCSVSMPKLLIAADADIVGVDISLTASMDR